jgi:hypothetical protein
LTIGDAMKVNGFANAGELHVGSNTATLLDANDAVFDSLALVTLGDGGAPGTLRADNGLTLDFGGNVFGHGAIVTPDSPAAPLTNNGHIAGASLDQPMTIAGYVRGVGTLDNVIMTGTDAPGFSAATVVRGSVAYDGVLEIELGGVESGSFDRIDHILGEGVAELGGELRVSLIDGFVSDIGDRFEILFAGGGLIGAFDSISLPSIGPGQLWRFDQASTSVALEVRAAFEADFNLDGRVDAADLAQWADSFGVNSEADADADGDSDGHDFLVWQRQLGAGRDAAAIPEPAGWMLLVCGVLGTRLNRVRQQRSR